MRCGPRSPASWTTSTPAGSTPWNSRGEAGHGRRRVPRRRRRAGRRRGHRAVLRHLRRLDRHLPWPGGVAAFPRRPGPRRAARTVRGGPRGRPAVLPPPGRALCPAQARTAGQALTDAITYRLDGPAAAAPTASTARPGPARPPGRHRAGPGLPAACRHPGPRPARDDRGGAVTGPGRRPRSSPGCGPGPAITTRTSAPLSSCSSSTIPGCGARTSPAPASASAAGKPRSTGWPPASSPTPGRPRPPRRWPSSTWPSRWGRTATGCPSWAPPTPA